MAAFICLGIVAGCGGDGGGNPTIPQPPAPPVPPQLPSGGTHFFICDQSEYFPWPIEPGDYLAAPGSLRFDGSWPEDAFTERGTHYHNGQELRRYQVGFEADELVGSVEVFDASGASCNTIRFSVGLEPVAFEEPTDPIACTDQQERARRFSVIPRDWDGTPFRIDFVEPSFPARAPKEFLEDQLEVVADLADEIENHLGYRIIEPGVFIEIPAGTPPGWNTHAGEYFRNDLLPRARDRILVFFMNDPDRVESARPGNGWMSAHVCCGTTSYDYFYFQAPHWTEQSGANSPTGEAIVHELFHLFGYYHWDDHSEDEERGLRMSRTGLTWPWEAGHDTYRATIRDLDLLGCAFPKE